MQPASLKKTTGHSDLYELAEHVLVNQYTHPHYLHCNTRMPLMKVVGLLEILEQIGIVGPLTSGQDRRILFTYFQRTQALADVEAYEAQRQHTGENDRTAPTALLVSTPDRTGT